MKRCETCRSTDLRDELVQEVFDIEGKLVLIEKIPARGYRTVGASVSCKRLNRTA